MYKRQTLIIFTILLLFYFIFFPLRCRICYVAKIAVIGIITFLFLRVQTDPLSFQKRIELILDASFIIQRFPLFGVGIGNYLYAQSIFPIRYPYFFLQPVHNIVLLLISETGLPFSLFLMRRIIIVFLKTIRKSSMLLPFIGFLLTGMIDHYWLTLQQNILLLAVMSGIFLSNTVLLRNGE